MVASARPDFEAIDEAVYQSLLTVLGNDSGVNVGRHPGSFEERGDEGRAAEIIMGLAAVDVTDVDVANPLKEGVGIAHRVYQITFPVTARFYNYVDYFGALRAMTALFMLDGYRTKMTNARPLLFQNFAYDSNENGYWNYEGELVLSIDTAIDLIFAPDEIRERRLFQDVFLTVDLHTTPIKPGVPDKEDERSHLDATLDIVSRAPDSAPSPNTDTP